MNLLTHTKSRLISYSILTFAITLTGCGGGGGGSSKSSTPTSTIPASSVAAVASSTPASVAESSGSSDVATSTSSAAASSLVAASSTPASSSSSSTNILASLIRDGGGLFGYYSNAGNIRRNALVGSAIETYEIYNGSTYETTLASDASYAYVLTPAGWVMGDYEYKVASFNEDGTITTSNATPWDIGNTLYVDEEIDLTGRNVVEFLDSYLNTQGMLATVNPTASFSSGAKAFFVEHKNDDPIYSVYFDPGREDGKCWWDGGDLVSESGGNCMAVNMTADVNNFEKLVSGYDKLFSTDVAVNTVGYRAVIIGDVGPNKLEMQIINNAQKTVKFYENAPNVNFSRLLATSTWSEITLPYLSTDNKAVYVEVPEEVQLHIPSVTSVIFAQQNDFLRPLSVSNTNASEPEESVEGENISFNAIANTDITTATTNYINPLVGNWKLGDDYFIFSNNNTFTQVKAATNDSNCVAGSATGTYSWNPLTSIVNVELQADNTAVEQGDSCAFDGKVELTLTANTMSFTGDGELFTLTKATSSTGLVGTWVRSDAEGYAVILFTSTQYFLSSYHAEDSGYGTESGTYTFNAGAGQFTPSVLRDHNDDAGFSDDNNQPLSLVIAEDNNSFNIDGAVLHRLK